MLGVGARAPSGTQPVADPVRRRAAAADPPVALGAAARRRRRASTRRRVSSTRATSPPRCTRSSLRAERFERPLSLIMADLDLLRDINNTYGHLAGDAVLQGIAEVFRAAAAPLRRAGPLRRRGVRDPAARDAARAGARDRRADPPRRRRRASTTSRPRASRSAPRSRSASPASRGRHRSRTSSIHQADLAVYRAKLQGRNRVLGASSEPLLMPADRHAAARGGAGGRRPHRRRCRASAERAPPQERRHPRPHAMHGPRFLSLSRRLARLRRHRQRRRRRGAGIVGAIFGSSNGHGSACSP